MSDTVFDSNDDILDEDEGLSEEEYNQLRLEVTTCLIKFGNNEEVAHICLDFFITYSAANYDDVNWKEALKWAMKEIPVRAN